ncbi:hypothetical protein GUJ93_ZPchr0002g23646 [Zizania palustris]|uniref:F-box domain-containing protein n=1 Tax=Zizania palustris TaxID=103762 RepID=A0A8J5RX30_ZIZPA|nr:hypothetical protein GUJ93_ZPchr0002g23646 [Zizania palustris]
MAGAGEEPPRGEIPEGVVEEIVVRLPSRSSLARAAAACSDFRVLISSPRFLRRHRARHRPDQGVLLGVFSCSAAGGGFHPAEPPYPAAAAACAVAEAADFSFAFLPDPEASQEDGAGRAHGWIIRDHRDGRFLLDRVSSGGAGNLFTDLVVCDPLSRRYVLLPTIPEELRAAVNRPLGVLGGRRWCEPFLSPVSAADNEAAEPSFTVIWMARCPRKVVAFAFSSRDGQWREVPSPECFVWSRHRSPFGCPVHAVWNRRFYAHGCFYWLDCLTHRWLVLDTRAMELTLAEIPSPAGFWEEHVAVVEGADGKVGVFAHDFYHPGGNASIYYYTIVHDGDGPPRWQLEKTVPLPWPASHSRPYRIRAAANGCLILQVAHGSPAFMSSHHSMDVELFKIDVKSFKLERICRTRCGVGDQCWPYLGFPPSLSLPTV